MEGQKLSMSKIAKECLFLCGMRLNEVVTSVEFFHWLKSVCCQMQLFMLSTICLLICLGPSWRDFVVGM